MSGPVLTAHAASGGRAPLAALTDATPALTAQMTVLDVGELMLGSAAASRLSLPVVVGDRPIGAVTRHALLRIHLMPYGRELYGRRPITAVMSRSPLLLAVDTPIDAAARRVAAHIRSPISEDFVIVGRDGRYLGMGAVLDLLQAVAERLTRRGDELERAHASLAASQLRLVQSEKMESLGQMVAGLVHEINTPLAYVGNNIEMSRAALADASRLIRLQEKALAGAADSATRSAIGTLRATLDDAALDDLDALFGDTLHGTAQIAALVGDLKDFSRLDQAGLQRVDLNGLVAAALRILQHVMVKRGIEVAVATAELPPVECAPAQINQVLLNLLGNAAQAIEHDAGRIVVRSVLVPGRVCVIVEDNGKGIAPADLGRIFDPFFTTKAVGQGTGLGLAIAHQIVETHGGRIKVASKPGVGTRFMVVLPIRPLGADVS